VYRPTSSNNIVNYQHILTLLDTVLLDLKEILPVLLGERRLLTGTRELASLSDGSKAGAKLKSQTGTEEEASGIKAYDNIGLDTKLQDLKLESADQGGVGGMVGEEREDVDEDYAWLREVGKSAKRGMQCLLCTGD
jgi:hypothetical protein